MSAQPPPKRPSMIGPNCALASKVAGNPAAAAKIKAWTRDLLDLNDDVTVMVTELACTEADCPPLETVIATLATGATTKATVHRPLADVTEHDVAVAFAALR